MHVELTQLPEVIEIVSLGEINGNRKPTGTRLRALVSQQFGYTTILSARHRRLDGAPMPAHLPLADEPGYGLLNTPAAGVLQNAHGQFSQLRLRRH